MFPHTSHTHLTPSPGRHSSFGTLEALVVYIVTWTLVPAPPPRPPRTTLVHQPPKSPIHQVAVPEQEQKKKTPLSRILLCFLFPFITQMSTTHVPVPESLIPAALFAL